MEISKIPNTLHTPIRRYFGDEVVDVWLPQFLEDYQDIGPNHETMGGTFASKGGKIYLFNEIADSVAWRFSAHFLFSVDWVRHPVYHFLGFACPSPQHDLDASIAFLVWRVRYALKYGMPRQYKKTSVAKLFWSDYQSQLTQGEQS